MPGKARLSVVQTVLTIVRSCRDCDLCGGPCAVLRVEVWLVLDEGGVWNVGNGRGGYQGTVHTSSTVTIKVEGQVPVLLLVVLFLLLLLPTSRATPWT